MLCKNDTTLQLIATRPQIRTIGIEGGIISDDEFYMEIAPGTITNESEIIVYNMPDASSDLDPNVTNTYFLDGLPEEYNFSTKIGLKHNGNLSNESVIEFGTEVFTMGFAPPLISYTPITSYDSAGFLWTTYPPLLDSLNPLNKVINYNNILDYNSTKAVVLAAEGGQQRLVVFRAAGGQHLEILLLESGLAPFLFALVDRIERVH